MNCSPARYAPGTLFWRETIMGHNDHIDIDLHERLNELEAMQELERGSKELGIARFVADNGISALSEKQLYLWNTKIAEIVYQPLTEEEKLRKVLDDDRSYDFSE